LSESTTVRKKRRLTLALSPTTAGCASLIDLQPEHRRRSGFRDSRLPDRATQSIAFARLDARGADARDGLARGDLVQFQAFELFALGAPSVAVAARALVLGDELLQMPALAMIVS